jgi:phosphomannomutase/phosphoglucomutase
MPILHALGQLDWSSLIEEQQLAALRIASVTLIRKGPLAEADSARACEKLDPLFPAKSFPLNKELCELLVKLGSRQPGIVPSFATEVSAHCRIGIVDENGRIIWGDELMVLLSRSILAEQPGATIIAEVKCSQNLFDDIAKHGGTPIMWKAGHSLIKSKMRESRAALAGEMSGHIFFADRYYGFDDATYAGARVLEILSSTDKPLSELLSDLPPSFSTPELRVPCSDDVKFQIVEKVAEIYSKTNKVITIDGARIIFDHGWGLVRASNTQAILVLRFEADSQEQLDAIQKQVESTLSELIQG